MPPISQPSKEASIRSPPAIPKFEWYQNANQVTVSYKIKNSNVFKTSAEVIKGDDYTTLEFSTEDAEGNAYQHRLPLFAGVARMIYGLEIKPMKVDVILSKSTPNLHWQTLEASAHPPPAPVNVPLPVATTASPSTATSGSLPGPYASKRNWQEIEKQAKQEEEEEAKSGDDPLNGLLRQIYRNADEDTRRAMNKSYQTSAGTVLTTNWKDASKKDFEATVKAPKGQVLKDWEGNVIADDASSESSLSEEEEEGEGVGKKGGATGNPDLDAVMRERRRKRREEKLSARKAKQGGMT